MRTRFTELIGCRLPFQLAVLGGVGTLELARAVEQAGGLGMMPRRSRVPEPGSRALGMGFLIPYLPPLGEVVEDVRGLRVAEFFWGAPQAALAAAAHSVGSLVSWQVGSAEEARAAEAAGCDLVVAQGIEAGGHVRGTQPLDELLADVADAVRVGTRFLACPECDTHPAYVQALIAASAGGTVLTDHFDGYGQWPAPVRVLRLSLEGAISAGNRKTSPPTASTEAPLAMACYAGLSVEHVREVKPASEIVRELTFLLA